MNFDEQPISTGGHGGLRHRRDLVPAPGCMAGVGDYRQMRKLLYDRNSRYIQRISQIGLERSDSPFADDDLVIATRHYVFSREQCLFYCRCGPALQKDRLIDPSQLSQQIEVLHVAGADLEDVDVPDEQRDL